MRCFLQAMHETGEAAFKRQLYQSLISQTLYLKTMIQAWRSSNIMISIWWMYNELWPTGACVVAAAVIAVTATLSVMSRVLCVIKSTERLTSTMRVCGCVAAWLCVAVNIMSCVVAGWGSIEYGSPVPGQVIGGRWKPLVRKTPHLSHYTVCLPTTIILPRQAQDMVTLEKLRQRGVFLRRGGSTTRCERAPLPITWLLATPPAAAL